MISPRGGDFYLATSGDNNLAVDTGYEDYSNIHPVTTGAPWGRLGGTSQRLSMPINAYQGHELGRCELRRTGERFRGQNLRAVQFWAGGERI